MRKKKRGQGQRDHNYNEVSHSNAAELFSWAKAIDFIQYQGVGKEWEGGGDYKCNAVFCSSIIEL